MEQVIIRFSEGEFECPHCGRRFPTHYRTKKGALERRQFGRGWIASNNNVYRHIKSCKEALEG